MTGAPPIHFLPITEIVARFRAGTLSAVDLVNAYLERIDALNDRLHAVITVDTEGALDQAAAADAAFERGQPDGPLAGIPLALKDWIPTRGLRTTVNCRAFADWIPDEDAAVVRRLREAGAIIMTKANTNEFLGIPSDDNLYPRPRCPWNPDYVSIGTSSGSGVSLAAGMCAGALGTDAGGSVRLPAAQHGLVGIKATHGRVSHFGIGFSSISDPGPLARTVADAALLLEVMAGFEPDDVQSCPLPARPYSQTLAAEVRGWRVGVPRRYIDTSPVEADALRAYDAALEQMAALGLELVEVRPRGLAEARKANMVTIYTELYAEQASTLPESCDSMGRSALLYSLQGAFVSSADYLQVRRLAQRIRQLTETLLREHQLHALALPTSLFVTADAARKPTEHRQGINTSFTGPFNFTGHPAISVPCGFADNGLPVGLQLVGRLYDEETLLQLAYAYEQATPWHTLYPPL